MRDDFSRALIDLPLARQSQETNNRTRLAAAKTTTRALRSYVQFRHARCCLLSRTVAVDPVRWAPLVLPS